MAYLILQEQTIPNWQWGGTVGYARVFASQTFFESTTGAMIPQGNPQNIRSFCAEYECTIDQTNFTIPVVTLATTTDSTVPNATYTVVLYDQNNSPKMTLFSQGFVDLGYLQIPAEGSVQVASAGTTSVNANYTYRGTSSGYPYYNVVGQSASTTLYAIVNTGTQWRIYDSAGTNRYHTSDNVKPNYPWDGTWVTGSGSTGSSPVPTVSELITTQTSTWKQLILSNQASATAGAPYQWNGPFWDVEQTKLYIDSIVGDGTTPYASNLVAGKTYLDTAPDVAQTPTAVGINSDRVEKVLSLDYNNSLATAVSTLGSTPATILIKSNTTVSGIVTIPSTIILQFENGALAVKGVFGGIEFEGFGLADPMSVIPCFSGFSAGNIVWTGTVFPSEISTELWNTSNDSLSDRVSRADAAMDGNPCKIVCFPRTITTNAIITEYHHLHFAPGEYENTLATYGGTNYPAFFLKDHTRVSGDNATIYGSPTADNNYVFYAYHLRYGGGDTGGINSDIVIEDLRFKGNASGSAPSGVTSTIALGNCQTGRLSNLIFDGMQSYNILVGGDSTLGNFANDVLIDGIICTDYVTQLIAVVNGKNINITNSIIDVTDYTPAVNGAVVDLECNATTDVLQGINISNLQITGTNNDIDSFFTGIAVNSAGGLASAITVRDCTILGRPVSTNTSYEGRLVIGIFVFGVSELIIENNYIRGAFQAGISTQSCRYVRIANNDLLQIRGGNGALDLESTANSDIALNRLNTSYTPFTQDVNIAESESEYLVTTTGSTVTKTTVDGSPRFFNFTTGLTLTINASNYVIDSVVDLTQVVTLTSAVGTLTVKTAASATDINTGTNTITLGAHNFVNGCQLRYTKGTVKIGGLTDDTTYFVVGRTGTTIQLALTLGGAVISLVSTGTGTQTFTPVARSLFSSNTYADNKADGGIALESAGSSLILSDYRRKIGDSLAVSIVANQNNYNPGRNAYRIDITTDASRNITGLVFTSPAPSNGERHELFNAGAQNFVIVDQSASSSAANRFDNVTGADITVTPGNIAYVEYNSTTARWVAWSTVIAAGQLPTAIPATNIADGSVSNAEFQRLDGVTSAIQSQIDAKAPLASPTFTGTVTVPTLASTTSGIGTATATSLAATGAITSSGTAGVGYVTGAGGTVTQATSKSTGVTLSKVTGTITMNNAALNAATIVSFTLTNTTIAATDQLVLSHVSGGTVGAYVLNAQCGSGSALITVTNISAGSLSEAIVIKFTLIKAVNA